MLAPPVPFNVIAPPPFVLMLPAPVREMPWHAPVVPAAEAVMLIALLAPVTEKFTDVANPTPPLPCPRIDEVAVTVPAVVNEEPPKKLIPLPPPVPPVQEEKVTGPDPVKAP